MYVRFSSFATYNVYLMLDFQNKPKGFKLIKCGDNLKGYESLTSNYKSLIYIYKSRSHIYMVEMR